MVQRIKDSIQDSTSSEESQGDDNYEVSSSFQSKSKKQLASPKINKRKPEAPQIIEEKKENEENVESGNSLESLEEEVKNTACDCQLEGDTIHNNFGPSGKVAEGEVMKELFQSNSPAPMRSPPPSPILSPIKQDFWTYPSGTSSSNPSSSSKSGYFVSLFLVCFWGLTVGSLIINEVPIWTPTSALTMLSGVFLLFYAYYYSIPPKQKDSAILQAEQMLDNLRNKRRELKIFLSQANTKLQRVDYRSKHGICCKKSWSPQQLSTLRTVIQTNDKVLEAVEHQIIQLEQFFIERQASEAKTIASNLLDRYRI
jgi:hypothetical protein